MNAKADTARGLPAAGATGEILAKNSATDYDVEWIPAPGGAPTRRPISNQAGTTFTPGVSDENTMVVMFNAAASTITLPSNTTAALPVGAEVDFLWAGVGQPTFVAGGGATANGTPGLKLRARYSAATAKKIATDDWVIIGDLAA